MVLRFCKVLSSYLFWVKCVWILEPFSVSAINGHCFPSCLFPTPSYAIGRLLCSPHQPGQKTVPTAPLLFLIPSQWTPAPHRVSCFFFKKVGLEMISRPSWPVKLMVTCTKNAYPSSFFWAHWKIALGSLGGHMRRCLPELKWDFVQLKALGELWWPQPGTFM